MTRMTRVVIKMIVEETEYFIIHRPTVRSVNQYRRSIHCYHYFLSMSRNPRSCEWFGLLLSTSHKCRYAYREGTLKELVLSDWPASMSLGHFLDCFLNDIEGLRPTLLRLGSIPRRVGQGYIIKVANNPKQQGRMHPVASASGSCLELLLWFPLTVDHKLQASWFLASILLQQDKATDTDLSQKHLEC